MRARGPDGMGVCTGDPRGKSGFQTRLNISGGGFPGAVFGRKGLRMVVDRETGAGGILGGREDLRVCLDLHHQCGAVAFAKPGLSD